jgi:hypothetical protein
LKFRAHELLLGVFLTIAVFAAGMLFISPVPMKRAADIETWAGWFTKDAAGFFTFWLVIVGVGQVFLFWYQLKLIRYSLRDAKVAADAAADAAGAASRQAYVAEQSLAKIERPYLFVFNVSALRVDEIEDSEEDYTLLGVTYSVANYGKIPAIIKHPMVSLSTFTEPLAPARLDYNHSLIVSPILAAGERRDGIEENLRWDGKLKNDEWNNKFPALGDEELWFWAIVAYRGPFTDQHETRICWRYDTATGPFIGPYGGPEYSGEK